jgi:hypothetical protein
MWKAWLGGLGDAVVNPGTPLGKSKMVSSGGVSDANGPEPLTGFSVVTAENIEAALESPKNARFSKWELSKSLK